LYRNVHRLQGASEDASDGIALCMVCVYVCVCVHGVYVCMCVCVYVYM
jgi:hypothetical protein